MLNFEVDRSALAPLLPKGTQLEESKARHFISLVGFLFLDTHVLGVPAFFHRDFEEVNLRFYVRRTVGEETRHAVVFIRELVPLPLVAGAARPTHSDPYRSVGVPPSVVAVEVHMQRADTGEG